MQKVTPKIILAGWCLWVLQRLSVFATDPLWHSGGTAPMWGGVVGGALMPGMGCWLAWRLYLRPRRSLAVWFLAVCGLLFWKFCIGDILFRMHPVMGGHTFGGAVAAWWAVRTASWISAAVTVGSLGLLAVSIAYWPAYCLKQRVQSPAPVVPPTLEEGRALCVECGRAFGIEEMIRHEGLYVCPQCKPIFLQKLGEGARVGAGANPVH